MGFRLSGIPRWGFAAALVVIVVTGCRSRSVDRDQARPRYAAAVTTEDAAPAQGLACRQVEFNTKLPLAEASGATLVPAHDHLLVVGDSGTKGEFNEVDPVSGKVLARGQLPLDSAASDDLEGLTIVGDTIYAVTSSGWLRHWRRESGGGYTQTVAAYPLAPASAAGPAGKLVCAQPHLVNCERNYEGLCLVDGEVGEGDCAGFAVAKSDGLLYCLVWTEAGRLAADSSRTIAVAGPDVLTGCDFSPQGDLLWVGTNLFAANAVYVVRDWKTPEAAVVTMVARIGPGFGEAIAVGGAGAVYRFSDTGGAPSLVDKHICE
jgi:hypothetical protein